jgi:hypothetical protein
MTQNGYMDLRRATLAALTAGLLFPGALWPAESVRPEDLAQGKILIMQRSAPDPLFARSVIVLARYDQTGALGLMIHYRSDLTIERALAGIKGAAKRTDSLFVGGPVALQGVLAAPIRFPAGGRESRGRQAVPVVLKAEHRSRLVQRKEALGIPCFPRLHGLGARPVGTRGPPERLVHLRLRRKPSVRRTSGNPLETAY